MDIQVLVLVTMDGFKDIAADLDGMGVIFSEVIGDAGDGGMNFCATQLFGRHLFAGGSLHQWWSADKNGSLVPDDDGLIAHGRHISAPGRAGTHHHGDLRDPGGRKPRLVKEKSS